MLKGRFKSFRCQLSVRRLGLTHMGSLLAGSFRTPRSGRSNDQAHPPIHPVNYVTSSVLQPDEARVYEFIARRFLACCSADATGSRTTASLSYGSESFHASGLLVLERNYLEVYIYERWESSMQLPDFAEGEVFEPDEASITEGKTSAPGYLTEPELISLMDANGIGTDATMAEHIAKIKEREYVTTRPRGGGGGASASTNSAPAARGRGRGRGSRGGTRGGRGGGGATTSSSGGGAGVQEFIPTTLGCALIAGYDGIPELPTSLGKPFLRKEMEAAMKDICEGRRDRSEVVHTVLEQYREVYVLVSRRVDVLKGAVTRYVLGGGDGGGGG